MHEVFRLKKYCDEYTKYHESHYAAVLDANIHVTYVEYNWGLGDSDTHNVHLIVCVDYKATFTFNVLFTSLPTLPDSMLGKTEWF